MRKQNMDVLSTHLYTILEYCFFDNPKTKIIILDFIDFVLSSSKLRSYVEGKLLEYHTMNYKTKVNTIKHLLDAMFEEKKDKKGEEHYSMKIFSDCLSSKTTLVFSLFNCRLNE